MGPRARPSEPTGVNSCAGEDELAGVLAGESISHGFSGIEAQVRLADDGNDGSS
jgi:hypothetical protein